ncbi:prolipoprotein diacylglyceryl transferase [Mycoplasmatota bacterium WC44]
MEHIWKPLPDSLDLGMFKIQFYALAILTGILVALWLSYREVKKLKMNPDDLSDGFTYGLIFGILGARLYYVIYEWGNYKHDIISAFKIWEGGLAIHGTIIAVAIFVYFYSKKRNISLFKLAEMIAPVFLLAQAFGRWGNFMNQEAHGGLVPGLTLDARREFLSQTLHLPKFIVNQMYLYGPNGLDYYHPTFLYESMWNLAGFIIMFFVLRKIKQYWIGESLSFYLIWYSIGRFFIENMRTDSLMLGPIQVARLISIVLALLGIALFIYRRKKEIYPVRYLEYVEGKNE